jgi:uracil-DNA glycosylase family protein
MVSRPSGSTPAMTQQSLLDSNETAAPLVPPKPTLPKLREAAAGCKACDLWKTGTQTVYGEGAQTAQIMFVGEQPGDREDIEGRPFVGPAGRLLDNALAEAGIDRKLAYVTNAVKHFKWTPRGKRRIHQKPNWSEIAACRPWLDAELAVVKPRVLVPMGATAAQALLGKQFRVTRDRGRPVESDLAPVVIATVHPSSILRADRDGGDEQNGPSDRRRRFEHRRDPPRRPVARDHLLAPPVLGNECQAVQQHEREVEREEAPQRPRSCGRTRERRSAVSAR